jgi:hypothetical protein
MCRVSGRGLPIAYRCWTRGPQSMPRTAP